MKLHGVSQWVDAQGDLKFIQNPIMREVQKFGEHEQASSHLFFLRDIQTNTNLDRIKGTIRHPYCNTSARFRYHCCLVLDFLNLVGECVSTERGKYQFDEDLKFITHKTDSHSFRPVI